MVELQERLIEAEDPYFELKNGGIRALKRLFELKGVLAQILFTKLDMVDGQLHEKKLDLCDQWFKSYDPSRKHAHNEVQN